MDILPVLLQMAYRSPLAFELGPLPGRREGRRDEGAGRHPPPLQVDATEALASTGEQGGRHGVNLHRPPGHPISAEDLQGEGTSFFWVLEGLTPQATPGGPHLDRLV